MSQKILRRLAAPLLAVMFAAAAALPAAAAPEVDKDKAVIDNAGILSADTDFASVLALARGLSKGEGTAKAAAELEALYAAFEGTPYRERVRLDFSIVNDVDYYNGIIFQGYVSRVPKMILSGGRYDGLLTRIGRAQGAMGFALNLGELNAFYPREKEAEI